MGLLDTHADAIRAGFDFDLRNPGPDMPAPSFDAWSFAKTGLSSLRTAGYQAAGNFLDLASESASANNAGLEQSSLSPSDVAQRRAENDRTAASFSGLAATMRQRATESMPDPITAHRADQVLNGVVSSVGRAAGAIGTLGPVAGGAVFGLSEADTTYQDLRSRGVDEATARKVAGMSGVVSAATAGLPAGGSTIARTAGIAAVAGPVSYMGEQAISRQILQKAGYADEAAMHDPTDPLGLALSIVLPGVMGAIHVRGLPKAPDLAAVAMKNESGGQRFGADGQLLTSPKGAQGEMQVMPGTATDPGFGVRPAALGPDGKPTPDELARVGRDYVGAMWQRYGDPEKTLAAYNAGPAAVDAAVKAHGADWLSHMPEETRTYVAKGMKDHAAMTVAHAAADPEVVDAARVQVMQQTLRDALPDHPDAVSTFADASDTVAAGHFDVAPASPVQADLEARLSAIESERQQLLPTAGNLAEPGAIRETRAQLAQIQRDVPDTSDAAVQARAKEIQAADRVSYKEARAQASKEIAGVAADFQRRVDRLQSAIDDNARAQQAVQRLGELDQQHAEVTQQLQAVPLARPVERPAVSAAREAFTQRDQQTGAPAFGKPTAAESSAAFHAAPAPRKSAPAGRAEPAAAAGQSTPAKGEAAPKPAGAEAAPSADVQRAEAAIAENPDLRVQLPGSTETVSAAEAMQSVREAAARDAQDAELVRAAIRCALSFG